MSQNKINVLIFPCEGFNAIELHDALSYCVNIEVYGASSVERQGRYIFERYINDIPNISSSDFLQKFNEVITSKSIDVVFPTHDSVAKFLVDHAHSISAKIISGDTFTTNTCRSKILTWDTFKQYNFIPTRVFGCNQSDIQFPVFVKPDEGQGAVGAHMISNTDELKSIDFSCNLVTEYLPGKEYTVDCLTDYTGKLRYVSQRLRGRTMAGVSVAGKLIDVSKEVLDIAIAINQKLNFLGLWYFQIKEDSVGKLKLMEISARCAGTMCLTRANGINLPLLSVYTAVGLPISIFDNNLPIEMERYFTASYDIGYDYDTVYIDFDDTLTLNGKVNLNAIRFLYQCRNNGKAIILITKHSSAIMDSLSRYAISANLFDQIISIDEDDIKSDFIADNHSIFIDNAFKERNEVHEALGIPVFDVDGIEFLIDKRN